MKKQYQGFRYFFTAADLAEPLASVSQGEAGLAKQYFTDDHYDVIGYKEDGEVVGYINQSKEVNLEQLADHVIRFNVSDLVATNTSLMDCLKLLQQRHYLFVLDGSAVTGIITMADMQKPPVSMLSYGLISFFESNLAKIIEQTYPHESWKEMLTEGRIEAAEETYERLKKKHHETNLINCTQLYDKMDIVTDSEALLQDYIHMSKSEAKRFFEKVTNFRNDIAHSQSITVWFTEYDVTDLMDQVIDMTQRILKGLA